MYQIFNSKYVVRMLFFDIKVKKNEYFLFVYISNQKENKRNVVYCLGKLFSINDGL